jgi:hypothetical protein
MDTVGGSRETHGANRPGAPEMPPNITLRTRTQMTSLRLGRTLAIAYSRAAEMLSHVETTYAEALSMDEEARKLMQSLMQSAPSNADFDHLKAFADHDTAGVLIKMGAFARAEPDEAAALREFKALSAADPKIAEYHVDVALALANMSVISKKSLDTLNGLRANSHEAIESSAQIAQRIQACDASLAALRRHG